MPIRFVLLCLCTPLANVGASLTCSNSTTHLLECSLEADYVATLTDPVYNQTLFPWLVDMNGNLTLNGNGHSFTLSPFVVAHHSTYSFRNVTLLQTSWTVVGTVRYTDVHVRDHTLSPLNLQGGTIHWQGGSATNNSASVVQNHGGNLFFEDLHLDANGAVVVRQTNGTAHFAHVHAVGNLASVLFQDAGDFTWIHGSASSNRGNVAVFELVDGTALFDQVHLRANHGDWSGGIQLGGGHFHWKDSEASHNLASYNGVLISTGGDAHLESIRLLNNRVNTTDAPTYNHACITVWDDGSLLWDGAASIHNEPLAIAASGPVELYDVNFRAAGVPWIDGCLVDVSSHNTCDDEYNLNHPIYFTNTSCNNDQNFLATCFHQHHSHHHDDDDWTTTFWIGLGVFIVVGCCSAACWWWYQQAESASIATRFRVPSVHRKFKV